MSSEYETTLYQISAMPDPVDRVKAASLHIDELEARLEHVRKVRKYAVIEALRNYNGAVKAVATITGMSVSYVEKVAQIDRMVN